MSVYEKEYVIQSSDVDMFRRLRLSRLFTFTQEAAIHHTEALGAGRAKTLDRGFLWVVMLQHAEIVRLPAYDERIRLLSWAGETMHVLFPRYYELYDETGACIVRGSALWALMDMNTRGRVFPDAEGISVEGALLGREYPLPNPIRPMETERSVSFTVPFSYADINGHLTNTRYFDIAEDLTSLSGANKTPVYAACEYAGEAKYGSRFDISVFENENTVYLAGTGGNSKKIFRLLLNYR